MLIVVRAVSLSAVETNHRPRIAQEIAEGVSAGIVSTRFHALRILAMATIRGQCLFCSELPIVRPLFEGAV